MNAPLVLTPADDPIQLAAVDSIFYSQYFFPRTFRQAPAPFHRRMWQELETPNQRLLNLQVMRDGAKTTILRAFASKRIAYALSRTILYIGKSESHAVRSVDWLRSQVLHNRRWADTFRLRKGDKFQGTEAQIYHGVDEVPIWILAVGIEGSVRGINLDDYRPDLIILDDVIDDENAATPEGRKKTAERVHGAIKESLAPASESPDAKLVMLNTPIAREDASMTAMTDPEWKSLRFGCWTPESENLPLEQRDSSWPERYPSETLRKQKIFALQQHRAHIFNREKECRITAPETSDLRPEWINFYEQLPERNEMVVVMACDPVPKPTPAQIAKGLAKKDDECWSVWGKAKEKFYLLEYATNKGHTPEWSIMTAFQLYMRWRPRKVRIESVAYQTTLAWILQQAMKAKGIYFPIEEVDDKRSKYTRILDAFQGAGSQGAIWVSPRHVEFISQWNEYPDVAHDDILDSCSFCVEDLQMQHINESTVLDGEYSVIEEAIPALGNYRSCP